MKLVGVVHQSKSSTRLVAVSFICMLVATNRILSVSSFLATPTVAVTAGDRHGDSWKIPRGFFLKTATTSRRAHRDVRWNLHRFSVSSRTATNVTAKSNKGHSRTKNTASLDDDQLREPRRPDDDSSLRQALSSRSVPGVTTTTTTTMASNVFLPLSCLSSTTTTTAIQLVLGHVLGGLLGLPFVAGAIPTWYRNIDLPAWTPPNQIFGPVWTLLYASMGWALSIVLAAKLNPATKVATATTTVTTTVAGIVWSKNNVLALWAVHYALNLFWAPVFFGLQRLRLGLAISYAMVVTLLAVMVVYHAIVPRAAYLLFPYLCWITFATALNRDICRRNPMCENGKTNKAMRLAQLAKLQRSKK